jgi:hypothetical protein
MSRISTSTSGVRVAAQPLSNIFTVLLIIGLLALILTLVMLWTTLEKRYGASWGVSDEGQRALKQPAGETQKMGDAWKKLGDLEASRDNWLKDTTPAPAAVAPAAPAAPEGGAAPVAPAPEGGAAPVVPPEVAPPAVPAVDPAAAPAVDPAIK